MRPAWRASLQAKRSRHGSRNQVSTELGPAAERTVVDVETESLEDDRGVNSLQSGIRLSIYRHGGNDEDDDQEQFPLYTATVCVSWPSCASRATSAIQGRGITPGICGSRAFSRSGQPAAIGSNACPGPPARVTVSGAIAAAAA